MIHTIIDPFVDFAFMRRALVGCFALSLGAPPVGVFLVLRRLSLMGDAMSHAILPGAAIGFLVAGLSVPAMSLGGFIAGIAVVLLAGFVTRSTILREDASLAAFYLVSLALDDTALFLIAAIATLTMLTLAVIYRPLVLECFDPSFLDSVSRLSSPTHFLFLVLVVLNLVGGFQALGTLMVVGIMLLPAITARFWAQDISNMIVVAVGAAFAASLIGLLVSYYANLPSGPAIILTAGAGYLVSMLIGVQGGLLWQFMPRRHLEA